MANLLLANKHLLWLFLLVFVKVVNCFQPMYACTCAHNLVQVQINTIINSVNNQYTMSAACPPNLTLPATSPVFALSGYKIFNQQRINFKTTFVNVTLTSIAFKVETSGGNHLFHLRYYIIFADSSTQEVQAITEHDDGGWLKYYDTWTDQDKVVVDATPGVIGNINDFSVHVFLHSIDAESRSGELIEIRLFYDSYFTLFKKLILSLVRANNQKKITSFGYSLILINKVKVVQSNYPNYDSAFMIRTDPSGTDQLFTDIAPNLGIPAIFGISKYPGYQGNCIVGIYHLEMAGVIQTAQNRTITFSTQTGPNMSEVVNNLPTLDLGGGNIRRQLFASGYNILCFSQCPSGTYFSQPPTYSCQTCPSPCLTCRSATFCYTCLNLYNYYLSWSAMCQPCSSAIQYCQNCSISTALFQFNCTICQQYYGITPTKQCQLCSQAMSGCLRCQTNTYCIECISDGLAFDEDAVACRSCGQLYPHCATCNQSHCLQCGVGTLTVNGLCTVIVGCIEVTFVNGQQYCLLCDTEQFFSMPVRGACQCREGVLVNRVCTPDPLCFTPMYRSDRTVYCVLCKIKLNLKAKPNSITNKCQCKDYYEFTSPTFCSDVCGDGFLYNTSSRACDDDNLNNGDGCSSACLIEDYYRCENGSDSSPSECFYIGPPIKMTLASTTRSKGLNQGVFTFRLSPLISHLSKLNYTQLFAFYCDSTYEIASVVYEDGSIVVTVDFTEDLQTRSCNASLSFNRKYIVNPTTTLDFAAISDDSPLIISEYFYLFETFTTIFMWLSIVALGTFVLSLSHKMIGAQLLVSYQLVYLSYALYSKPSLLTSSLQFMRPVSGYWSAFDSNTKMLSSLTSRIQFSPLLMQTSTIIPAGLMIFVLILGIFLLLQLFQKPAKHNNNKLDQGGFIVKCIQKFIKDNLLFPFTIGFYFVIAFAAIINQLRVALNYNSVFSSSVNALFLLATFLIMANVMGRQCLFRGINQKNGEYASWYIPYFVFRQSVALLFFSLILFIPVELPAFILLLAELLNFFLMVFKQPYISSVLDSLGVIFCVAASVYALIFVQITRLTNVKEPTQILLIIGQEGLLILAIAFALIRTIRNAYQICNNHQGDDKKVQEQKLPYLQQINSDKNRAAKEPAYTEQREIVQLLHQRMGKSLHKTYKKRKQESSHVPVTLRESFNVYNQDQERELQRIKKKLRKDIRKKKAHLNQQDQL